MIWLLDIINWYVYFMCTSLLKLVFFQRFKQTLSKTNQFELRLYLLTHCQDNGAYVAFALVGTVLWQQ